MGLLTGLLMAGSAASLLQAGVSAHQRGDYAAARAALKPLAAQGSAAAETLLGGMAARGQGARQDRAAAAAWWLRAANRGYAPAQLALARALADGRGVGKDMPAAWLWARRAMTAGGAVAGEAAALAEQLGKQLPPATRAEREAETWVAWPG